MTRSGARARSGSVAESFVLGYFRWLTPGLQLLNPQLLYIFLSSIAVTHNHCRGISPSNVLPLGGR